MSLESAAEKLKQIQERFLGAEEKTGIPELDVDAPKYSEPEEIDVFMAIAQNSAMNAFLAIDMLLRHGSPKHLDKIFGDGSSDLLKQTKECLEDVASMFQLPEAEEQAEPTQEPTDVEVPEEPIPTGSENA